LAVGRRANLYFAAILEIDRRSEHHLIVLLDAPADLDLGSLATDSLTELAHIAERHPGLRYTIETNCGCASRR